MFNFCYFIRYLINEIIILKAVLMQIDPLHIFFFFIAFSTAWDPSNC